MASYEVGGQQHLVIFEALSALVPSLWALDRGSKRALPSRKPPVPTVYPESPEPEAQSELQSRRLNKTRGRGLLVAVPRHPGLCEDPPDWTQGGPAGAEEGRVRKLPAGLLLREFSQSPTCPCALNLLGTPPKPKPLLTQNLLPSSKPLAALNPKPRQPWP